MASRNALVIDLALINTSPRMKARAVLDGPAGSEIPKKRPQTSAAPQTRYAAPGHVPLLACLHIFRRSRAKRRMQSVDLDLSDVFVRLLAAAAAGGLVGLNRDLADKPIGVRTLGLVSLGAATVSLAGLQVQGMAESADALSRVVQGIIQGVMAGISFIGAGVILRNVETRNVEGLTTAATVWVSAALGVACGLGAWRTIAIAIPVTMAMLFATGWIDQFTKRDRNNDGQ